MAETPWHRNGLRFTCSRCGRCCGGGPGTIRASDDEIAVLAAGLGMDEEAFRERYTRRLRRGDVSLIEKDNHDCIFYDRKRGCTVYEDRPRQCRTWPFWRANLVSPEHWEEEAERCPGMNTGHLHRSEELAAMVLDDGTAASRRRGSHSMIPLKPLAVLALLALLLPGAAHADAGPSWSFEVLEVTRTEGDEHLIRLRPLPPGKKFPKSCETFVVRVRYDVGSWSAAGRQGVTRAGHERSLRFLAQAQTTKDIVRFGAVGQGFAAIPDRPKCEVSSRALVVLIDGDGSSTVYSVFNEPRAPRESPRSR